MYRKNSDDNRVVRSVTLLLGNSDNKDDRRILQPPNVVLLLEVKDVDSNKEHSDKEALAYEQDGESLVGS